MNLPELETIGRIIQWFFYWLGCTIMVITFLFLFIDSRELLKTTPQEIRQLSAKIEIAKFEILNSTPPLTSASEPADTHDTAVPSCTGENETGSELNDDENV